VVKLSGFCNEISNLNYFIEKSVEISQNISKYWHSGTLDVKKSIQKIEFPEGIKLDTRNWQYLTHRVNSLFFAKHDFMRTSRGVKKRTPHQNDEESSIVQGKDYFMILLGVLNKSKTLHPSSAFAGTFYCSILTKASFWRISNKKPRCFRTRAFSL
jgi:hypothetical protein